MDLSGTMQGAGGVGGLLAVRTHGTSTDAGLYYYGYRFYDPLTRRCLQKHLTIQCHSNQPKARLHEPA